MAKGAGEGWRRINACDNGFACTQCGEEVGMVVVGRISAVRLPMRALLPEATPSSESARCWGG